MTKVSSHASSIEQEQVNKFASKVGISIILSFGIMLCVVSFAFITIGIFTSQLMGIYAIPINLFTISLLLIGAIIATYYYHTRYIKRELILKPDGFWLKIGRRSYEYLWSDFSIVALSVSYSHYGAKGFIIKLFVDDLEGEYVDLSIYHFSKSIDAFNLRSQIEEKVRLAHAQNNKA